MVSFIYRAVSGISSRRSCPPKLLQNGCSCFGHPLSSDGVSTSLKPAQLYETSRRLSVRYDGFAEVTLYKLATGLATLHEELEGLPRTRSSCRQSTRPNVCDCSTSRLNGLSVGETALLSLASTAFVECSPDLPSNGSSLRDLDCTHSNCQTLKSPALLFIVTTSLYQDWVICAPAAFLGCGSRFSGSLSGIEP
jgi:hypothetical protein